MAKSANIPEAISEELCEVVTKALKKASRRFQSVGLDKSHAVTIASSYAVVCCAGAICATEERQPPSDERVIKLTAEVVKMIREYCKANPDDSSQA